VFVDDGPASTEQEEWLGGGAALRRLNSGAEHRIVKVPLDEAWLRPELARLGWQVALRPIRGGHVVGTATRQD
jgi:hypothetical protein